MMVSRLRGFAGSSDSLRRQLVSGGAASAVIKSINLLLSLALGIALARGLGADGYGVYAYAFAWLTLLLVVAGFGMPVLLVREVAATQARNDWGYFRGVIGRALQIVFISAIILDAIVAVVLWLLSGRIFGNEIITLAWIVVLLPLLVLLNAISAALRGMQHVVKTQAIEMLVRPAVVLLGVLVIFAYSPEMRQPHYVMSVQSGAAILLLGAAALMLYRYLPLNARGMVSQYRTRDWLASAVPLTVVGGAGIINSQADILMLGFFQSSADVGVYRVAVQGATLVAFGLQVANFLIAPQFARLYALGDKAVLQRLVTMSARIILFASLPVALALMFAGGTIAGWLFGPEFEKSHMPMAILAGGQLISSAMGSVALLLNMTGHERDVARIMVFSAGLNILLNIVLIPPFQLVGAASATTISLATWNILLYRVVKERMGIDSTALAVG